VNLGRIRSLPRPLAFVLPGGGALGAYQVGILKALTEAQVAPDLLIGVSAGAVNAALFAWNATSTGIGHLEQIWRSIRRRDLLRVQPGRITMAAVGRRPSFFDSRPGETFLRKHLGMRQIQHAPVPLVIVATNLHDGRPVVMTDGDAASAVVASCSFPAVYPPVRRGDVWLIDGGVVADIPLDIAAQRGAASALVLSVPPLAPGTPRLRAIDLLFRASTFGVEAHGRTVMLRPPAELEVLEVVAPPSPATTFSIGTTDGLIDEAYEHTVRWLTAD
jgi:NTE family protein